MERLLQEERRKNGELVNEVTKYSTMVNEKNEMVSSLRRESNKYKEDFERLNNDILMKLTALLNRPDTEIQNKEEIRRLFSSLNKLDRNVSLLNEKKKEIIHKNDNNFYLLNDRLNKALNEMKSSKQVETVTKTIIQPPPRPERIIRTPIVHKRVIKASPSPNRVYRELPKKSTIHYNNQCTCSCNRLTVEKTQCSLQKCPICKVGFVKTIDNPKLQNLLPRQSNNLISANESMTSQLFTEKSTGKIYGKRMSTEPMRSSGISNHLFTNSPNFQENQRIMRKSLRYSVEPMNKVIKRMAREPDNIRIERERDPYMIETIKQSNNIQNRGSYIKR